MSFGEDYVVSKIVDHKMDESGLIVKYKVRWKNYGPEEDSWVSLKDMHCPNIIKNYQDTLAKKRGEKVDGKYHTWVEESANDSSDDEVAETDRKDKSITVALRSRAKRGKSEAMPSGGETGKANISFIHLFEAGLSSDEETFIEESEDDENDSDYDIRNGNSRKKSLSARRSRHRSRSTTNRLLMKSQTSSCLTSDQGESCQERAESQPHCQDERYLEGTARHAPINKTSTRKRCRTNSIEQIPQSKRPNTDFDGDRTTAISESADHNLVVQHTNRVKSSTPVSATSPSEPSLGLPHIEDTLLENANFTLTPIAIPPVFDDNDAVNYLLKSISPSLCANDVNFVNINEPEISASSPPEVIAVPPDGNFFSANSVAIQNDQQGFQLTSIDYSNGNDVSSQTCTSILQPLTTTPTSYSEHVFTPVVSTFMTAVKDVLTSLLDTLHRRRMFVETSSKVWSSNYLATDEEKQFFTRQLAESILRTDMQNAKKILLSYRACDLYLNNHWQGETLIALCCKVPCDANHLPCEIIDHLIFSGVDINGICQNGLNALMIASIHGFYCKIKTLLKRGARTSGITPDGYDAVQLAVRYCPLETAISVVTFLFDQGADIRWQNYNNQTALDLAYSLHKTQLFNTIKDFIQREEQRFMTVVIRQAPNFRFGEYFKLQLRCLEIINQFQLPMWINENELIAGYSILLCLAGIEVQDNGGRIFFPACSERSISVYFNGRPINIINTGKIDIFEIKPWNIGENVLVIKNLNVRSCLKVMVQMNRAEYLQPRGFY